jgi:hypothetical protein
MLAGFKAGAYITAFVLETLNHIIYETIGCPGDGRSSAEPDCS